MRAAGPPRRLRASRGPIDQLDHAERATKCAIELQRMVSEMNAANAFPEIGTLQIGVGVANDRQIWKSVKRLAGAVWGTDESPLLHVTQVIVAEVRVPLQQLATRKRGCTGRRHDATNIIHS